MTYQEREDGKVTNLYQITLINKTFESQKVELKSLVDGIEVELLGNQELILDAQSKFEGRFFLVRNQDEVKVNQEKVKLSVIYQGEELDKIETNFTAPIN
jgi:hypothetical protein